MKRITIIVGTRPEAIKMAPVFLALKERESLCVTLVSSGQHARAVAETFASFHITEYLDLGVSSEGLSLHEYHEALLPAVNRLFEKETPDWVLVHGDTVTAFTAALSAFYLKIPVAHVEAGLRTYELWEPYPEEFHRHAIDVLSSVCFAPTEEAAGKLIGEGKKPKEVLVTGNTVLDALAYSCAHGTPNPGLKAWVEQLGTPFLLVTAHRRENWGEPLQEMMEAVKEIAVTHPELPVVLPMNPNPIVRQTVQGALAKVENVRLIEPMDVVSFHYVLSKCLLVLTDSGGLQEEGPALGKPVLVMRRLSERQEGIADGSIELVGTTKKEIVQAVNRLLDFPETLKKRSLVQFPFGKPGASEKIAAFFDQIEE